MKSPLSALLRLLLSLAILVVAKPGLALSLDNIITIAGGVAGDGNAAPSASLNYPSGITVSSSENLYIADIYNNLIRKVIYSGVAPSAPTVVSPTSGNGQVTVSWTYAPGATSYNLYYSTTPGVTKVTGTKIANVSTSPYTITPLTNGTTYYFIATALNGGLESAESAQISAIPAIPTVPGAAYSLTDLTGTWYHNSLASGSDAPWWQRATMTVAANGSFTGSAQSSDGDTGTPSGTLSISADGTVTISGGGDGPIPCRLDAGKTVMVCTSSWVSGGIIESTEMKVFTKRAASYSQADLTGDWVANQIGTPGPHFMRGTSTISSNGTFYFTYNSDNTASGTVAGTAAITAVGNVTISIPALSAIETCNLDASKTFMACVDTDIPHNESLLTVYTKKAASYAQADMAGSWGMNVLATSPGAPWWLRASFTVDSNGLTSGSMVESDGNSSTMSGSFAVAQSGVVTTSSNDTGQCSMNVSKSVVACTFTWNRGSPGTDELAILTKQAVTSAKTLTGLAITAGSASLFENSNDTYTASANWSDGTSTIVTPTWSVSPTTYASINSSTGVLTTLTVPSNQIITVTASYTSGGITLIASWNITIVPQSTTLTITISGTGAGSVNSNPSGPIACTWPPQTGTCSTTQPASSSLVLTATPDIISTFGGWSNACTNSTGDCTVIMDANKSVAATFTAAHKAMIGSTGYASLYAAYTVATDNAVILLLNTELPESMTMGRGIGVTLKGGYNADFSGASGLLTSINGPLIISTGSLAVDNVRVK